MERTRTKVNRAHVVRTVKDHLAARKTAKDAVRQAMQEHGITLPTPALADAIAQATDRQITLAATDGFLHSGKTNAEIAADVARTKRIFQLFNALEALATLPDLDALLAEIPDYCAYRVDDYLEQASDILAAFRMRWKAAPITRPKPNT
jgi:hypothetical protein